MTENNREEQTLISGKPAGSSLVKKVGIVLVALSFVLYVLNILKLNTVPGRLTFLLIMAIYYVNENTKCYNV